LATVLIVDDHLATARVVAALLRTAGHRAHCAPGGHAALARLETERPDLIVLDVMMPDLDGMAVLRRLRSDPRFDTLPVLMYSALDDGYHRAAALEAGAQGYVVKGRLDWPELQAVIERHLTSAAAAEKTPCRAPVTAYDPEHDQGRSRSRS